jgi:hypothetical protein
MPVKCTPGSTEDPSGTKQGRRASSAEDERIRVYAWIPCGIPRLNKSLSRYLTVFTISNNGRWWQPGFSIAGTEAVRRPLVVRPKGEVSPYESLQISMRRYPNRVRLSP